MLSKLFPLSLALVIALLLGMLIYVLNIAFTDFHIWARYLLPLVIVYFWGRRREIYVIAAFLSLLMVASFWLEGSFGSTDVLAKLILPLVLLWSIAWLSVRRLRSQEELQQQVAARTAELQASERHYRLLADNATDVIWAVDMDANIIYLSPSIVRLRGYSRDEMLAMTWDERLQTGFPEDLLQAVHACLADLRAGRAIAPDIFLDATSHRDGTPLWLETEFGPLYDEAGRPVGLRGTTRNTTARHTAEEALRQSEARFTKLFDFSPVGLALTRLADGLFREVNAAFAAMIGYSPAEVIGRTSIELGIISPADRARLAAALQEQGNLRGADVVLTTKGGELLSTIFSIDIMDFDGEPWLLSSIVDITARKHAEAERQVLVERWSMAAQMASIGVWDWSAGSDEVLWDERMYLLHGLVPGTKMTFAAWRALIHPDDRAAVAANSQRSGRERTRTPVEYRVVLPDGSLRHILSIGGGRYDETGMPVRQLGISMDITERVQAERQIRSALQRLKLATEAAGIGVWTLNLADGSLDWDSRVCELYAVTAEERREGISYDFWRSRVHPDDLGLADPAEGDSSRIGGSWLGTYRIVLPGGAIRHVQANALVEYDDSGKPWRVTGINRDITDQICYEQLLEDNNAELEARVAARTADLQAALVDLQRASNSRDEFMAMISHELRTPLTGVLSLSELLADEIAGPLNDRQAVYVKGIVESGERLLAVINGILGYTHLLSGRIQLAPEPCDLAHLLGICAASQRHKAAAKNQTIALQVTPPDLAMTVDPAALAEVLKRLLDNAVKFTPEGGQIGLEAHTGCTPGTVDLVVWDTGIGIAGDQQKHVFHAFTQADSRLARSHEGIGLGLAFVDQMVRLLGGTISVESTLEEGSRFTVTLPA